jgi:hypothetical protein
LAWSSGVSAVEKRLVSEPKFAAFLTVGTDRNPQIHLRGSMGKVEIRGAWPWHSEMQVTA